MSAATKELKRVQKLRKRLIWSLLFIVLACVAVYMLHSTILVLLQRPLNDSLYYTAPTAAFNFILKLSIVFGLIVALPVVIYQVFGFFGPLLPTKPKRSIIWYVAWSVVLACLGITFAYFVSLPAALHFIVNFGNDTGDIQALITADEYFNFVLAYIAGFAVLFQLPLFVSFLNRVKPMRPKQMLSGTRYVILGSFIFAAIITPTPDPINQSIMAVPIILLYFLSIFVIMFMNRNTVNSSALPEIELSKLNDILSEKESAMRPITAHQKPQGQPIAMAANNRMMVQKPRGLVSDMVMPGPSKIQQKPVLTQTAAVKKVQTKTAPSPDFRVGLISDFVASS